MSKSVIRIMFIVFVALICIAVISSESYELEYATKTLNSTGAIFECGSIAYGKILVDSTGKIIKVVGVGKTSGICVNGQFVDEVKDVRGDNWYKVVFDENKHVHIRPIICGDEIVDLERLVWRVGPSKGFWGRFFGVFHLGKDCNWHDNTYYYPHERDKGAFPLGLKIGDENFYKNRNFDYRVNSILGLGHNYPAYSIEL